jgi:hypothetical protein
MATAYLEGIGRAAGWEKSFCDNSSGYIFKKDTELQRRTPYHLETIIWSISVDVMKIESKRKAFNHKVNCNSATVARTQARIKGPEVAVQLSPYVTVCPGFNPCVATFEWVCIFPQVSVEDTVWLESRTKVSSRGKGLSICPGDTGKQGGSRTGVKNHVSCRADKSLDS